MRIVVAMSGGVDSTAAAWRLQQAGHEIIGLTMVQCPEAPGAAGLQDPADAGAAARAAAARLGIRWESVDLRAEFEIEVIAPFLAAWSEGRTPNPCALCNRRIKFEKLRQAAGQLGAEAFATGHYARHEPGADGVWRGRDPLKDQSYFLALVPREQWTRVWFPLGETLKSENESLVADLGLHPSFGRSSMDVCFLHGQDPAAYIRARRPDLRIPGEFVDETGRRLGEHSGWAGYTIGQRKGLGIAAPEPVYVLRLEPDTNRVVVGTEDRLWRKGLSVQDPNWIDTPPAAGEILLAQVRYRQKPVPAAVAEISDRGLDLEFLQPVRAVTPGQIAVLYRQDRLVGGGTIAPEPWGTDA